MPLLQDTHGAARPRRVRPGCHLAFLNFKLSVVIDKDCLPRNWNENRPGIRSRFDDAAGLHRGWQRRAHLRPIDGHLPTDRCDGCLDRIGHDHTPSKQLSQRRSANQAEEGFHHSVVGGSNGLIRFDNLQAVLNTAFLKIYDS